MFKGPAFKKYLADTQYTKYGACIPTTHKYCRGPLDTWSTSFDTSLLRHSAQPCTSTYFDTCTYMRPQAGQEFSKQDLYRCKYAIKKKEETWHFMYRSKQSCEWRCTHIALQEISTAGCKKLHVQNVWNYCGRWLTEEWNECTSTLLSNGWTK